MQYVHSCCTYTKPQHIWPHTKAGSSGCKHAFSSWWSLPWRQIPEERLHRNTLPTYLLLSEPMVYTTERYYQLATSSYGEGPGTHCMRMHKKCDRKTRLLEWPHAYGVGIKRFHAKARIRKRPAKWKAGSFAATKNLYFSSLGPSPTHHETSRLRLLVNLSFNDLHRLLAKEINVWTTRHTVLVHTLVLISEYLWL